MHFDFSSKGTITTPFLPQLDTSASVKQIARHFNEHPARWNTAFTFLSKISAKGVNTQQVLQELHRGKILLSSDVYVNVEDYMPKPLADARYEAHQQYIDIQYVAAGEEYIGLSHDTSLPVLEPFNAEKDIAFYQFQQSELLLADPSKYFIFFPTDLHAPCLQTSHPQQVTKIVVKIRLQ